MTQDRVRPAVPFVFMLILLLAAWMTSCDTEDAMDCQQNRISTPGNYTNVCTLKVKEGASSAHLHLQIALTTGDLDWTLQDPEDGVRWRGKAQAGEGVDQERIFEDPIAGTWKLEFKLHEAAGEYSAPWTVR